MQLLKSIIRVECSNKFDSFGFYSSELEYKYLDLIDMHSGYEYPTGSEDYIDVVYSKNERFACTSACGILHWFGLRWEYIVKDFKIAIYLVPIEKIKIGKSKIQCVFYLNDIVEKRKIEFNVNY